MRNSFLILISLVFFTTHSQDEITWDDLADVTFTPTYNAIYEMDFLVPTFGKRIGAYVAKTVSITGYFLDISGSGEVLLLSKQPMALCFFCGGAGPETIIEVNFKEKPKFKTDQIITVTGVLQLNADDVDHCNFILNKATGQLVN